MRHDKLCTALEQHIAAVKTLAPPDDAERLLQSARDALAVGDKFEMFGEIERLGRLRPRLAAAIDVEALAAENAALREEMKSLRREIAWIRSASSAGFARGTIKRPGDEMIVEAAEGKWR